MSISQAPAERGAGMSPQATARFAGACYLLIAAIAMYAIMGVFAPLIDLGDAEATLRNITANEQSFRVGIFLQVAVLVLDVLVAWALYLLFRPASPDLSLLTAWLRLTYVFVHGAALISLVAVLVVVGGPDATSDPAGTAVLVGMLTGAYYHGFAISLIIFGLHLLVLGVLIYRSRFLPRLFALFLALACAGYLVNNGAALLMTNYAEVAGVTELFMMVTAMLGEFTLLFWLLIRGVDVERWRAAVG